MNAKFSKILNLGCGRDPSLPEALSVDCEESLKPDVVHDLTVFPWPFENNTFEQIYCKDILEHLPETVRTLEEIHRIATPRARVLITTPHYSCANAYTDPTHVKHFGLGSMDYFTGDQALDFYSKVRFRKVKQELYFYPGLKNKLIWRLARRFPKFYEEHLAWIFPAFFIAWELEVLKPENEAT